ncbi:MAG TPA: molybdopterin-dependent oxidoreductase, partial [Burkholderiales bacterium]|nr:molybdopterin-dependent oxidoreductase [Burkholderiales bacterium]
ATAHQTVEELYLLQKLMRGLGSGNVDTRLAQSDFRADGKLTGAPWLGMPVAEINRLDRILVIGSTLRQDHPLLAHRMRAAVKHGAEFSLVNPVDDDLLMKTANKLIVAPQGMVNALAQIVMALADQTGKPLPQNLAASLADVECSATATAMAASLAKGAHKAIFLGNLAQHHPAFADLHALAQTAAELSGAVFGFLGEAANSVGAYVAGAVPHRGKIGLDAAAMLAAPRKAYLLLGAEPELDCYNPALAMRALRSADMVVAMSAYKHAALDYADVLLPIAPFTETAGTFISTEGRVQSFKGAVAPLGETRPAWKVLRVLGTMAGLQGFDYDTAEAVRQAALKDDILPPGTLNNSLSAVALSSVTVRDALTRIGEIPMYQADAVVRRAEALQKTPGAAIPEARMNSAMLHNLGLESGAMAKCVQDDAHVVVRVDIDNTLPDGALRLAAAHPLTAVLGAMMGEISVERV